MDIETINSYHDYVLLSRYSFFLYWIPTHWQAGSSMVNVNFLTLSFIIHHNRQTIDMAKIRRCPTCKVVFPTIDAVNDHYKTTSHIPLPYKCGSCEQVYEKLSILQMVGI